MTESKTASLKRAGAKPSLKDRLIILTKTGKRKEKQSVIRGPGMGSKEHDFFAMDFTSELSSVGVVGENSQSSGPWYSCSNIHVVSGSSWKTRTNTLHLTVKIIRKHVCKISRTVMRW